MGLIVRISTIVGSGDFEPRLIIDIPEVRLVHDLTLESTRDAVFILNEEYWIPYMDATNAIKAAIRDSKYTIPADTLEWANEK